jgi:hypothetical protein
MGRQRASAGHRHAAGGGNIHHTTQYNLVGPWTVRVALNGRMVGKDTFELLSRKLAFT